MNEFFLCPAFHNMDIYCTQINVGSNESNIFEEEICYIVPYTQDTFSR